MSKSLGMESLRETVARSLGRFDLDGGIATHSNEELADAALAALGLDDLDAAAERLARYLYAQGHGYDIDADPVARDSMLTVGRGALEAACTATDAKGSSDDR